MQILKGQVSICFRGQANLVRHQHIFSSILYLISSVLTIQGLCDVNTICQISLGICSFSLFLGNMRLCVLNNLRFFAGQFVTFRSKTEIWWWYLRDLLNYGAGWSKWGCCSAWGRRHIVHVHPRCSEGRFSFRLLGTPTFCRFLNLISCCG